MDIRSISILFENNVSSARAPLSDQVYLFNSRTRLNFTVLSSSADTFILQNKTIHCTLLYGTRTSLECQRLQDNLQARKGYIVVTCSTVLNFFMQITGCYPGIRSMMYGFVFHKCSKYLLKNVTLKEKVPILYTE